MTQEQKQVRDWMAQFGQDTPSKPTIPDLATRKLRAKLILEEALETVEALGLEVQLSANVPCRTKLVMRLVHFVTGKDPQLAEIADGCEDLKVVTEGTLVACGLVEIDRSEPGWENGDPGRDPLFNEVMRSNQSKLWSREELEHDWPEMRGMEDITGSWHNPGVPSRHIEKKGDKYLVKDESGKVQKSPSYSPANLQPFIDQL